MSKQASADVYKKNAVMTASPGKITLMLFDAALRFTTQAKAALDLPDQLERAEKLHKFALKAQNIILELRGTLNMSIDDDFPKRMYGLYGYMFSCLTSGVRDRDPKQFTEVYTHLKEIRDAWAQMLANEEKAGEKALPREGISVQG